jgi:4-amino-4-deoxy-L-arabinose transferase-like glycosyltransferase
MKGRNAYILLLLLLALMFVLANGMHVINYPPRAVHQWRQSDGLAYAQNYYSKNLPFFKPAFYNLVSTGARSISELPILYYVSAQLYRIFGFHYWVLRGLSFLIYLCGLVFLLKTIRIYVKDALLSVFPVIILASTPYFYYYALNTLPNVPAISLSFVGLYYCLRYMEKGSARYWVFSFLCLFVSSLLKPTDGGLLWVALGAVYFFYYLQGRNRSKRSLGLFLAFALLCIAIYAWYKYASWYNAINNNVLNLLGVYPIWTMDALDIRLTINERILNLWLDSYQHIAILIAVVPLLLLYFIKWKQLQPFLRSLFLFILLGTVAYNILWFKAYGDHDYYQLVNVIMPTFLCITMAEYYERVLMPRASAKVRWAIQAVLLLAIFTSLLHNRFLQNYRFSNPTFVYINPNVYTAQPFLKQVGISELDTIVSVPDPTPNISLTAFWRMGYTANLFGENNFTIAHCKEMGARYMIITDSNYIHNKNFEPYTGKLLGVYKGIYAYDLR